MSNDPAISVIVPVYKVEAWLPACVQSLLGQTFRDFELILVDDGSPDGCGRLCDGYALADSRVQVIHRPNGGLSAARNSGLAAARGEYIAFVDSDDVVLPDYLERLYAACRAAGADMAVCAVQDVAENGEPLPQPVFTGPTGEGVFEGRRLLEEFFGPASTYYTVAWNKLYKAHLWRDLRYPEGLLHEDDAVAHLLYWNCGKVACLAQPLYHYRLRQGSICRTGITPAAFDGVSAHAAWCRFFAAQGHPDLAGKALPGCWRRYLSLCAAAKAQLSWPLAARWHACQAEMRALLPLLAGCAGLSAAEKRSCRRWAKKALPLPPAGEKPRVALLLPPGLPVPAVQGGAVETLAQHLVQQNGLQGQLELAVVCQYDDAAAALAGRWPDTLFYYQTLPAQTLLHRLRLRAAAAVGRPLHWQRWYAAPLPFLKRLNARWYLAEGGDLTGWQQASRVLGRGRFVAHLHGETAGSPLLHDLYAHALCISDYVRGRWLAGGTATPQSAALLPNCVDLSLFCPTPAQPDESAALRKRLGLAPNDFVVLFCGRTSPEKGVHQLLAAFEKLDDAAIKLLVVGSPFFGAAADSDYQQGLRRAAQALGERVKFTGFVPNAQLPAYYRLADAACLPALWQEPAGITAIEAMACGCPVIATQSGGMPEYLQGSGAVLLPRSQVYENERLADVPGAPPLANTIAAAILQLRADPARRAKMAQKGAAAALRYSAECYYKTLLAALAGWEGTT